MKTWKRWLWFVAAVCISTGFYYTIRYGLRPKPIPVMNATDFTDLEQIGVVTYKRLRTDVRAERLVLLGVSPAAPEDVKVWTGFLRAAAADKEKIVSFERKPVDAAAGDAAVAAHSWETVYFTDESLASGELFSEIKSRLKLGQLIVMKGLTPETSHLVEGSQALKLDRLVQHPVLAISTLRLVLQPEEIDNMHCLTASEDPNGQRRLGCASQRIARHFIRRKLDPSKIWAVVERHGLKEYLVFIHSPVL